MGGAAGGLVRPTRYWPLTRACRALVQGFNGGQGSGALRPAKPGGIGSGPLSASGIKRRRVYHQHVAEIMAVSSTIGNRSPTGVPKQAQQDCVPFNAPFFQMQQEFSMSNERYEFVGYKYIRRGTFEHRANLFRVKPC